MNNGHWKFPEQMGEKDYVGFIYVIIDRYMGHVYLGKKDYHSLRGKNEGKESNWKRYRSSSKFLKKLWNYRDLKEFDFIVLEQYKTKGGLRYAETWSLCTVDAPLSTVWYNTRIEGISFKVTEAITERHKQRLQLIIKWAKRRANGKNSS